MSIVPRNAPLAFLLVFTGCGLVYSYGDYQDQTDASTVQGGAAGSGGTSQTDAAGGSSGTEAGDATAGASGEKDGEAAGAAGAGDGATCECRANPAPSEYLYVSQDGTCAAGFSSSDYVGCGGCDCAACGGCPASAFEEIDVYGGGTCTSSNLKYLLKPADLLSNCVNVTAQAPDTILATVAAQPPVVLHVAAGHKTLCKATDLPPCSNGVCLPTPPGNAVLCLLMAGDVSCPLMNAKQIVYPETAGTCDCSCTQTCEVSTYATSTCTGAKVNLVADNACHGGATFLALSTLPPYGGDATCTLSSSALQGGTPYSLCCGN